MWGVGHVWGLVATWVDGALLAPVEERSRTERVRVAAGAADLIRAEGDGPEDHYGRGARAEARGGEPRRKEFDLVFVRRRPKVGGSNGRVTETPDACDPHNHKRTRHNPLQGGGGWLWNKMKDQIARRQRCGAAATMPG